MRKTTVFFILLLLLNHTGFAQTPAERIYSQIPFFESETVSTPDDIELSDKINTAVNALMPQNIISYLGSEISAAFKRLLYPFPLIISIIFLSSLLGCFKNNLNSFAEISDYALLLGTILICFNVTIPLINYMAEFLNTYVLFLTSMTSSLGIVGAFGGNVASDTASVVSATAIIGAVQICAVNIIIPCARVTIALGTVNTLSKSVNLFGIINFIKSFCTWGLGVLFAIFGGIHSVTVKIASSADSLAVRSIRFTAARLIPVAGNMLSESLRTVVSGMHLIKNVLGGLGIAYIIYSIVPVISQILCVKLCFLICSFCSKIMGQNRQTEFLESMNSTLNILLAVALFACAGGILIFAVFISTAISV